MNNMKITDTVMVKYTDAITGEVSYIKGKILDKKPLYDYGYNYLVRIGDDNKTLETSEPNIIPMEKYREMRLKKILE